MSPVEMALGGAALAFFLLCAGGLAVISRVMDRQNALIAALNGKGRELAQAQDKEAGPKKEEKERVRVPMVT